MSVFIDLVGKKFGRLLVLCKADTTKSRKIRWLCVCDCGTFKVIGGASLKRGDTVSCGCYLREILPFAKRTHGHTAGRKKTSTYTVWKSMRHRCNNPRNKQYMDYGGRGITVCERWENFENFYADMGDRPEGLSLDRINNDKGYSPDNCRWSTSSEQCKNKRKTKRFLYKGEMLTVTDIAEQTGIRQQTLWKRLVGKGEDPVIAITGILSNKRFRRQVCHQPLL